jgi:phosphoadenosine phosphosulfate reductase
MERLQETMGILRSAKEKQDACLVAFSAGKDSLCVLDMCCRTFSRVEAFFMYFIPGLEVIERQLDDASRRWGIKIHQVPHWTLSKHMSNSIYMWPSYKRDDLKPFKLRDVYNLMKARTGIEMIATGARRADSLWRRRNLANIAHYTDLMYPVVGWGKADVFAYLAMHNIPVPPSSGGEMTGIGLVTPDLLWLHDEYPDDFRKLLKIFPFAEAVVWRRTFYGVGNELPAARGKEQRDTIAGGSAASDGAPVAEVSDGSSVPNADHERGLQPADDHG